MFWIFLSLAIVSGFFLPGVAVWGYLASQMANPQSHVAAGLIAAVFTVFVHSLVFVYFMGSSKSLKDAILRHSFSESLIEPAVALRRKAFPWAWGASSVTVATAILGGGVWAGFCPAWVHGIFALVDIAIVWIALGVELSCIRRNGEIIDRIRARIESIPEGTPEKEVEEHLGLIPLGKGLVITGCSVWALFFYMRWIMEIDVQPLPWFALASLAAVAAGIWAMRQRA